MNTHNNETKFYDIYDYLYMPFWRSTTFFILLMILSAVISGMGAYFLVKYMRKKSKKEPQIPPWEWALKLFKTLTPGTYETKDQFKLFYFKLTQITKKYLEQRFEWDLMEKTDNEMIECLKTKQCNEKIINSLEEVLQGSLLIKFANAEALREQAQKDLNTVIYIVKKTKPRKNATKSPL